jgi:hypothetical protein
MTGMTTETAEERLSVAATRYGGLTIRVTRWPYDEPWLADCPDAPVDSSAHVGVRGVTALEAITRLMAALDET